MQEQRRAHTTTVTAGAKSRTLGVPHATAASPPAAAARGDAAGGIGRAYSESQLRSKAARSSATSVVSFVLSEVPAHWAK